MKFLFLFSYFLIFLMTIKNYRLEIDVQLTINCHFRKKTKCQQHIWRGEKEKIIFYFKFTELAQC